MADGKIFEDKVSIEDLIKKPQKVLLANIYQQVLKTNGIVARHSKDIDDINGDIDNINISLDSKIGTKELLRFEKMFAIIAGVAGFIIVLFNILDRVL